MRLVIELKRGEIPQVILNQLYKYTPFANISFYFDAWAYLIIAHWYFHCANYCKNFYIIVSRSDL